MKKLITRFYVIPGKPGKKQIKVMLEKHAGKNSFKITMELLLEQEEKRKKYLVIGATQLAGG